MFAKLLFALFLIYEAQCFKYFNTYSENHDIDKAEEMFKEFLEATEMVFTGDEYHERLAVFTENIKIVNNLNSRNGSAKFGITRWSHLTPQEFKERMRFQPEEKGTTATRELIPDISDDYDDRDVPSSMDWRDKLPPVKNQKSCGNCWIFSGIGAIEAQYANVNNEVVSLSEQQVQDCTTRNCSQGGLSYKVFKYAKEFGGIMLEKDYPYISANQTCLANVSKVVARVTSYTTQWDWSEDQMRAYVGTTGPLVIGINGTALNFYISGILDDPYLDVCGKSHDHDVLITGYSDDEKEHWIIRNSWGKSWGEKGYFRIVRNKNACAIGTYAATVTVAKN